MNNRLDATEHLWKGYGWGLLFMTTAIINFRLHDTLMSSKNVPATLATGQRTLWIFCTSVCTAQVFKPSTDVR